MPCLESWMTLSGVEGGTSSVIVSRLRPRVQPHFLPRPRWSGKVSRLSLWASRRDRRSRGSGSDSRHFEETTMSKALSVTQMLDHLEARIAHLRDRRAFHAEQEAHHREQLALHDAELQKVLERFEAFKTAAEAAAEVALPPPPAAALAEGPIPTPRSPPRGGRPG